MSAAFSVAANAFTDDFAAYAADCAAALPSSITPPLLLPPLPVVRHLHCLHTSSTDDDSASAAAYSATAVADSNAYSFCHRFDSRRRFRRRTPDPQFSSRAHRTLFRSCLYWLTLCRFRCIFATSATATAALGRAAVADSAVAPYFQPPRLFFCCNGGLVRSCLAL